jgi:hypothetical protein
VAEERALKQAIPHIWCDFNAAGWSGEPGDDCYYVLDKAALHSLPEPEGMRVFIFDYENVDKTEILGCEAILERTTAGWLRARPDRATWYSGPIKAAD